jgi:O-methyltransferase
MSAAKSLFVKNCGSVPAQPIAKLATWLRFARWYKEHGAGRYGKRNASYAERPNYFSEIVTGEHLADQAFDFLEFGVYQGESLRWWSARAKNPNTRFVGFDSFTGLPDQWDEKAQGFFATNGRMPKIDDTRVTFEVGLFHHTLPQFLAGFRRNKRLIVHMDADLYSSSIYVLMNIGNLFRPGDLLMFDEFSTVTHEFKAFEDFQSVFHFSYLVPYATGNFDKVCLRIS